MSDPVQEIKHRLSIEEVVATYVPLKKAGKHFKANCPFHQEKTPSFYVSPERQIAYCFSCRKGGDLFQFVQEIEGLDFRGALELLAEKANVELPKTGFKSEPKLQQDEKVRLKSIHADSSTFFVQSLFNPGAGEKVLDYLKKRGLTEASIRTFEIGFAPDSKDDLYRFLLDKSHEKNDLLQSDMVLARDAQSQDIVDRFHLRLMFPIADTQGDVIAFGGRALKQGDQPKYLNSPESALYDKSRVLYNLHRAKIAIRAQDRVVVVEGYMDAIASHQAGVEEVVASCGTALTESQLKLLKRYTQKIFLAFDADSAGQDALLRAVHAAQTLDLQIYVVRISGGKDAAELAKEDPLAWKAVVDGAVPYLDHYFALYETRWDLSLAEGKRFFSDAVLELLHGVTHPVERDHYLKVLSVKIGTPLELLYDHLNQQKSKKEKMSRLKKQEEMPVKMAKEQRLREAFFGLLLNHPDLFFGLWAELKNSDAFLDKIQALGLIQRLDKLDPAQFEAFRADFPLVLANAGLSWDATSVYKQIEDHYNRTALVDESFYASVESGELLKTLAFEAEVNGEDKIWVEEEFLKLVLQFYFQFTPLNAIHG